MGDIGEFTCEALSVLVLLLISRHVAVEPEGDNDAAVAVVLAVSEAWEVLFTTLEIAEIVLFVNEGAEVLVQVDEGMRIERLLLCHLYYNNYYT